MAIKIVNMNELFEIADSHETPSDGKKCVSYENFKTLNDTKWGGIHLNNETKYTKTPTRLVVIPDIKRSLIRWEGTGNIIYSINVRNDFNHTIQNPGIYLRDRGDGTYEAYENNPVDRYFDPSEHEGDGCQVFRDVSVSPIIIDKTITSVAHMFCDEKNLTKVDLSMLDTSNLTSFNRMFKHCVNLKEVIIGNIDTSMITNFGGLFDQCYGLQKIDVSNLDTSNATAMNSMFGWFNGPSINVTNLKTDKNTNFGFTFIGCANLTTLDLSTWKTPKLETTVSMFDKCYKLKKIDMSNFDMTNVTTSSEMFRDCRNLKQVIVTNCNSTTRGKLLTCLQRYYPSFVENGNVLERP